MNIPFTELEKMPTRDRKAYIQMHNNAIKREKEEYDRLANEKGNKGNNFSINSFTDQSQQEMTRRGSQ